MYGAQHFNSLECDGGGVKNSIPVSLMAVSIYLQSVPRNFIRVRIPNFSPMAVFRF